MSILYKLIAVVGIALALVLAFYTYRDAQRDFGAAQERTIWQERMKAQQKEAEAVLSKETVKLAVAETLLKSTIANLREQREKLQAENVANLRKYVSGRKLQFVADAGKSSGSGGSSAKGSEAGAASDAGPAIIQLSGKTSDDLYALAGSAQSLLIDYRVLYSYVQNPKLTCSLEPD